MRARSVETAASVIAENFARPPEGYRLDRAMLDRRGRSGRSAELAIEFLHVDRRVPEMTLAEALETFELDATVAAGSAEYEEEIDAEADVRGV